LAGNAEVLAPSSACHARFDFAWPTYRKCDEIARDERANAGANLDDLAQSFVSEHEPVAAGSRRSIVERGNLTIRAAYADLSDPHHHVALTASLGRRYVDNPYLTSIREDRQRSHRRLLVWCVGARHPTCRRRLMHRSGRRRVAGEEGVPMICSCPPPSKT